MAAILLAAVVLAAPVPKALPPDKTGFPPLDAPQWEKFPGGIRVWDVRAGTGDAVQPGDTVTVRYTGWLSDGTKFDGNKDAKTPTTFELKNLVKGWQEGLPGMKVGGIRRLVIPPALGYGDKGIGKVPANSTLVFEIELIETDGP